MTTVSELKDIRPELKWHPDLSGPRVAAFVEKQRSSGTAQHELERVVIESTRILGRCVDPNKSANQSTGLVVGKIQSGKTMSFTALAALAHDNGFGLVIILAGVKTNLLEQTVSRLQGDLNISEESVGQWIIFTNPQMEHDSGPRLKNALQKWLDPAITKNKKRVPFVVVLKHQDRLHHLTKVILRLSMENLPVLIIDDESDQAGLNTYSSANRQTGSSRMSANYKRIKELRESLPFHAYVQYTATPQANLLTSIQDQLSPDFAEIITPGESYTGGKDFFYEGSPYVIEIPQQDLVQATIPNSVIPHSLVEAFSIYVYGCAFSQILGYEDIFTMMIHPSQATAQHKKYFTWAKNLLDEWRSSLSDPSSEDRATYIYETLNRNKDTLQKTIAAKLPDAKELPIYEVISNIELREVNSTLSGKSKISWGDSRYWLIVGGAKLDRGFTVKGLTITYMPRPLGDGKADSAQQRARFFGYKKKYFQFCRVYLDRNVIDSFVNYVEHESIIHHELEKCRGQPLHYWERLFFLSPNIEPTRKNVIGIDLRRLQLKGWVVFDSLADDEETVRHNENLVYSFISSIPEEKKCIASEAFPDHFIDRRPEPKDDKHILYEGIPLNEFCTKFFEVFRVSSASDIRVLEVLKIFFRQLKENSEAKNIDIFVMRSFKSANRGLSDKGRINPFQGRSPSNVTDLSKLSYGGDQSFKFNDRVSLQIHFLNVNETTLPNAKRVRENCPWLCFHIPDELARSSIIESS